MLVVDLLRLAITFVLVWWLRPHAALLWRFAAPTRVRCRMLVGQKPPDFPVIRELLAEGFSILGLREEITGRFLERQLFCVLSHPDGIFADVPVRREPPKGKLPVGLYLTSCVEDSLFLVTKRVGPEITRGTYVSQRETGQLSDMLRRHRATLARLGLGLSPRQEVDAAARKAVFTRWHRLYARLEWRPYAVLSAVLCLLGLVFLVRIWTFSY